MGASRKALLALVAASASLAACDAIIGLDSYSVVSCEVDCGFDSSKSPTPDTGLDTTVFETSVEAGPDGAVGNDATMDAPEAGMDAEAEAMPQDASTLDVPLSALDLLWARWPMPNPDAALAPESSTPLPNRTTYTVSDAGPDGTTTVTDGLTGLEWIITLQTAHSAAGAEVACTSVSPSFHAPSRIQLLSLVDFTRSSPAIDPVFQVKGGIDKSVPLWTATPPELDGGWVVDFTNGTTYQGGGVGAVLCVRTP